MKSAHLREHACTQTRTQIDGETHTHEQDLSSVNSGERSGTKM